MKTEKILLKFNESAFDNAMTEAQTAADDANKLQAYLAQHELTATPEEIKEFIMHQMNPAHIAAYVSRQHANLPKLLRDVFHRQITEVLKAYVIYYVPRDFSHVEFKDGKYQVKAGTGKKLKEYFTTYLTNPEAIDRYHRLQDWIDQGNALRREFGSLSQYGGYIHLTVPDENQNFRMNIAALDFE